MTQTATLDRPASILNPLVHLTERLHEVARRMDRGDTQVGAVLQNLCEQLSAHPDPRATGLLVFAQAMTERLAGDGAEIVNLYLRRYEVPQIQLFNLLGRHVPLASMATRMANDVLAQAIAGETHPTLIDIGMGTGRQFCALLDDLAAAGALPAQLTVIGIEPAAEALVLAQELLESQAAHLGLRLHFHGYAKSAEALSAAEWTEIADRCTSTPALNAAFALHHIADDAFGCDQRNAVLSRLAALRPRCLVIAEPDVDHHEPRFAERFRNCITHFGAVFRVLDALPLQQTERDALKVGFFGREISDVLGRDEAQRSERHETAERWMQRLVAGGFQVDTPEVQLPDSGHPTVRAQRRDGCIAITGAGEPLVSLLVATPR